MLLEWRGYAWAFWIVRCMLWNVRGAYFFFLAGGFLAGAFLAGSFLAAF